MRVALALRSARSTVDRAFLQDEDTRIFVRKHGERRRAFCNVFAASNLVNLPLSQLHSRHRRRATATSVRAGRALAALWLLLAGAVSAALGAGPRERPRARVS